MSSTSAGASAPQGGPLYWPGNDFTVIPDWIYTSEAIYEREVERIFHGPSWNFVALEAEIPHPGDFKRSFVGATPVVVARGADGEISVFQNRCVHRGAEFCRQPRGNAREFVCPYHQWTYDLAGNLIGIPFRRGVKNQGGMPPDFRLEDNGLLKLTVTRRHGVVFASFGTKLEALEDYLGPEILTDFDATFDGRPLRLLGYYHNEMPGNWKLYHENLKDPYHATLLHTYLVTFGLLTAAQRSAMISDSTGRHGTMASAKGAEDAEAMAQSKGEMRAYRADMQLHDGRMLEFIREFDSPWSVTMQTIWPNLVVQRELNTLGVRHIVPKGPNAIEMHWIMFGYADDSEEMTRHRLRQGNLMGPAGFLGIEDNEAMGFVQEGLRASLGQSGLAKLGGSETGTSDHLITEAAIRGMYRYYADVMGLMA